jgi:thiosulfate dehydrogenase [quinone] large subunit
MSRRERRRPTTRRPAWEDSPLRTGSPARGRPDVPAPAPWLPGGRLFVALLPLRFFVGATFLYAGVDKILDPHFLRSTGPGSIGELLTGFTHGSPLGALVSAFALPAPVLMGLLIALADIAIGLGALTGLLFRASAAGGAALSILFFLTASWGVHPYYYGPDLPYAASWLTLALAGNGGLAVLRVPFPSLLAGNRRPDEVSPERRAILQGGLLAVAAVAVAGLAGVGIGLSRGGDRVAEVPASPAPGAGSPGGSGGPGASAPAPSVAASAGASAAPAAGEIASLSSLQPRSALPFVDPTSGDPAMLIRLANGNVVAFDAICTHQGCTVQYDQPSGLLFCPCHGAVFDPTHNADVLQGPAPVALAALPIAVDKATGAITLRG